MWRTDIQYHSHLVCRPLVVALRWIQVVISQLSNLCEWWCRGWNFRSFCGGVRSEYHWIADLYHPLLRIVVWPGCWTAHSNSGHFDWLKSARLQKFITVKLNKDVVVEVSGCFGGGVLVDRARLKCQSSPPFCLSDAVTGHSWT